MAKSKGNPISQRTILVTGATGKQGGAALRHLRQRGFPVRALTRDPSKPAARALLGEGMAVVRGDYDDPASLAKALDGVYGVFSVQTFDEAGVDGEVRQGKAMASAAQRSRISHFVYTSVAGADRRTGIPHFESKFRIEEHLRVLGMKYTILRPVFFMENWLGMAAQIQAGSITLPLTPERSLQQIAVDDIGAFAALAFEYPGRWQDRTVELAGDERSMADVASLFGRVMGHEVHYTQMAWDEFEQRAGQEMTHMWRWFQETGYSVNIAELRTAYPRLTSFERWIQAQDWGARRGGGAGTQA
ncbi:MAG TPA: NmrA/HSCARG family protein [Bryobacteraceae bacterium]|nr:NmrA/HSCARG family protein [Bryobacteraceae bacterium]